MKAPLSACLITRGEPTLQAAVDSVRPFVAEVCIAYTGEDEAEAASVERLADRFVWCTACLDMEGRMADFSVARRASFALATQPWLVWLDSDDIVVGGAHFDAILGCASGHAHPRLLAPYDYAAEPLTGEVSVVQWRERIVRDDGHYDWHHPVHETLVAKDGRNEDYRIQQPIRWVHQRTSGDEDSARNLRILERAVLTTPNALDDAWLQLNLGLELAKAGQWARAAKCLERYVEISRWDDERVLAMLRLSDVHVGLDPRFEGDAALYWARQAHELRPQAFAPLYSMARIWTLKGTFDGDTTELAAGIVAAEAALATPPDDTPLAVNVTDRKRGALELIRNNAEWLEDWPKALSAAERLLAEYPHDGPAKWAVRRYGRRLGVVLPGVSPPPEPRVMADVLPRGLDILILCGETGETWNPQIAAHRGIGGSETAVIEIARRLAAMGHRLTVYCNCGPDGLYDEVHYTGDLRELAERGVDVMVAWRDAQLLVGMGAEVKLIWAHDVGIHHLDPFLANVADRVVAVSEWHKGELLRRHGKVGLAEEKIVVLRNGIEPARFACTDIPRNPRKAIYSSSADRGLEQLLEMWPVILRDVPDAELHVFYGRRGLPSQQADRIAAAIRATPRVFDRGRVNQEELAREMLSAGAWLFPSWHGDEPWTETSCIGAMEAQAAGLRIVIGASGALTETVLTGIGVDGDMRDPVVQGRFVFWARAALMESVGPPMNTRAFIRAEALKAFDWQPVAQEWDRMLRAMVEEKRKAA